MTDIEKFEAWLTDGASEMHKMLLIDKYQSGTYRLAKTENQWQAWQAALASQQPAGDGWIEWCGDISVNEQPVKGMVEVTYRNGVISKANAAMRFWGHQGIESDIIAYRVVKP